MDEEEGENVKQEACILTLSRSCAITLRIRAWVWAHVYWE